MRTLKAVAKKSMQARQKKSGHLYQWKVPFENSHIEKLYYYLLI